MKHYSYAALLRQRSVVAALTLGLVIVMVGVMLDLLLTSQRTTIATPTQRLIEPLNPQLDLNIVTQLEAYPLVTLEEAKQAVSQTTRRSIGTPGNPGTSSTPGTLVTPAPVTPSPVTQSPGLVPSETNAVTPSEPGTNSATVNVNQTGQENPATPNGEL